VEPHQKLPILAVLLLFFLLRLSSP
jgi:hypothetical protein